MMCCWRQQPESPSIDHCDSKEMMLQSMISFSTFLLVLSPFVCRADALSLSCSTRSKSSELSDYKPHLRAKIAHSMAKGERRASERSAQPRQNCDRCSRPPALCVCEAIPDERIETKTHLLILQHPNERRKKNFSTVPLLRLVLQNVQVLVGYTFDAEQLTPLSEALSQGRQPLLLYPGPGAVSLDDEPSLLKQESPSKLQNPSSRQDMLQSDENLLIVVDGTWTEAKRMIRDSPSLLNKCQLVQFTNEATSIYNSIREEPEPHCLSTLEACAKALRLLEPSPKTEIVVDYLHGVLQSHVNFHLVNARMMAPRSAGKSTAKLYAKNKRRREIELELFADMKSTSSNSDMEVEVKRSVRQRRILEDGAVLRSLMPSDAKLVDSWWEYQSSKSLPLVSRRIEIDNGMACLGVEVGGSLVACILRYEGGALGMLHVEEKYRRRGYGSALLQQATQILKESDEERVAFIVDGNHASETVFEAAGWERDDPNIKRRTGKRRAKRKWVHK